MWRKLTPINSVREVDDVAENAIIEADIQC